MMSQTISLTHHLKSYKCKKNLGQTVLFERNVLIHPGSVEHSYSYF